MLVSIFKSVRFYNFILYTNSKKSNSIFLFFLIFLRKLNFYFFIFLFFIFLFFIFLKKFLQISYEVVVFLKKQKKIEMLFTKKYKGIK
jgi:hypothetical protein